MSDQTNPTATKSAKRRPCVSNSCIGCGACTAIAGEVFALNDDGISTVLPLDSYEGKDVDDAIAACPVRAIAWEIDAPAAGDTVQK